MALKKSELYSSFWQSCDELRGGMDASQYKDYVLVLLFLKYISNKYAGKKYAPITIPEGASFSDMAALKGKASIGDDINKKIIAPLANARCCKPTRNSRSERRPRAPISKIARADLTAKVAAKDPTLTEDEIKALVVDDKWLAPPRRRRAGRTRSRLPNPHRSHPPTRRTLRQPAAAARR